MYNFMHMWIYVCHLSAFLPIHLHSAVHLQLLTHVVWSGVGSGNWYLNSFIQKKNVYTVHKGLGEGFCFIDVIS